MEEEKLQLKSYIDNTSISMSLYQWLEHSKLVCLALCVTFLIRRKLHVRVIALSNMSILYTSDAEAEMSIPKYSRLIVSC